MRTIEFTDAAALQIALSGTAGEDVVILRDRKPVALITPFDDDDLSWYAAEHDPEFIASIARARAQVAAGETISHEQLVREIEGR